MGEREEDHCPLCGLDLENADIPKHIRYRCEMVERIRVEEMGLPPEGYDARERGDIPGRNEETGEYLPAERAGGEAA